MLGITSLVPFGIEKNWTNRLPEGIGELEVNRWWGQRPEMFSFVRDGVLFMSSNLLNAPEEKEVRQNGTRAWQTVQLGSKTSPMQPFLNTISVELSCLVMQNPHIL